MSEEILEPKYYLIACGTKDYDNESTLARVPDDLDCIVKLFKFRFGYEHALPDLWLNPSKDDISKKFLSWLTASERRASDRVVFYYAGHGVDRRNFGHYLWLQNTESCGTALETKNLLLPLIEPGVQLDRILYIIDTCHSEGGAIDIATQAVETISRHAPRGGGKVIRVDAIAACRTKQKALDGLFAETLEQVIEEWDPNDMGGHLDPGRIMKHLNDKLPDTQRAKYHSSGFEGEAGFFYLLPKKIFVSEEESNRVLSGFLDILSESPDTSVVAFNTFALARMSRKQFVSEFSHISSRLQELIETPIRAGICPLILFSEWCEICFDRSSFQDRGAVSTRIREWQKSIAPLRSGAKADLIKRKANERYSSLERELSEKGVRIQMDVKPETKDGMGRPTGNHLLNASIWFDGGEEYRLDDLPLGKFAENLCVEARSSCDSSLDSEAEHLKRCLATVLPDLIRQMKYSLPRSVRPAIEIFLPFDFYETPLEELPSIGTRSSLLGMVYPIAINSYERYFDEECWDIRYDIREKKSLFWKDKFQKEELILDNANFVDSEKELKVYVGTKPTEDIKKVIERESMLAAWSRDGNIPLEVVELLKNAEWKQWQEKIRNLRKRQSNLSVTLFQDDLFPKPPERPTYRFTEVN